MKLIEQIGTRINSLFKKPEPKPVLNYTKPFEFGVDVAITCWKGIRASIHPRKPCFCPEEEWDKYLEFSKTEGCGICTYRKVNVCSTLKLGLGYARTESLGVNLFEELKNPRFTTPCTILINREIPWRG